ncbi:hypothetical protein Q5752_002598 [Cryptotrichosporon argae]
MSVWSTVKAFQSPAVLLLVIFGPSFLPRLLAYVRRPRVAAPPRPPLPLVLKTVFALHSLYYAYHLVVPPYDVFVTHGLPILAPVDRIRAALLRSSVSASAAATLPTALVADSNPLLDLLLSRLGSLDARLIYARVGHAPFASCVWCRSLDDFTVAALPGVVAPYVAQAAVLGALGWRAVGGPGARDRARRWRAKFGSALLVMAATDVGARYFWDLRVVDGDCLHLASTLSTLRALVLLALPFAYTYLPAPPPPSAQPVLHALATTLAATRLVSLTRAATAQSPLLRRAWNQRADVRTYAEARAKTNADVRDALEHTNIDPARARANAAAFLDQEWGKVLGGLQKM